MGFLDIANLNKTYRGRSGSPPIHALQNLNMTISEGEIVAVLGLNGAGKTSLAKVLAGLITPDTGSVSIGRNSDPRSSSYLSHIGAVFEGNRNIYWRLTAFENLEYFAVLRGLSFRSARQRSDLMLSAFHLVDKKNTIAAHLSRGMQQRLAIAIALVHQPSILVLDEPTLGVDIENVLEIVQMLQLLKDTGVSVVLTTHQLDVVEALADKIALIVAGRLVAYEKKERFMNGVSSAPCVVEISDNLDASRETTLKQQYGVSAQKRRLTFSSELLYPVLEVLKPITIVSVGYGDRDFTETFLRRVRDHEELELVMG